jgi:hypothetical protein
MLHIIAGKHDVFRMLAPKQRPPFQEVWHLWTVIVPRRSITGRLLWGTVLRRRDEGRWIYKKFQVTINAAEYRRSARALIRDCKKNAPPQRRSLSETSMMVVAVAALSLLFVLPAMAEQRHHQSALPVATCDNNGRCTSFNPTAPMAGPRESRSKAQFLKSTTQKQSPVLDANGNPADVVVSGKTGARARVGIPYAGRFQAYIDDLENNYGAHVLFMGGIRPGRCTISSEHPCGKALDVCQLRRGVVDPRCHLPGRIALGQIAASHGLFEGGRWCNSDYGHVQVGVTAPACGELAARSCVSLDSDELTGSDIRAVRPSVDGCAQH